MADAAGSRGVARGSSHVDAQIAERPAALVGRVRDAMVVFALVIGVIASARAPRAVLDRLRSCSSWRCVAAFLRPTVGVYVIVFLTLVGDIVDDGVVAVHEEHVEPRVDLLRQRLADPQPARGAARRDDRLAWLLQRLDDPTWRVPPRPPVLADPRLHRRSSCFGFAAAVASRRRHAHRHLRGPAAASTCRRLRPGHEPADDAAPVPAAS